MELTQIDFAIIAFFLAATLFIGLYVSKRSSQNSSEYFLAGRNLPWWLLGFSMVATTFSTDTPNLVTDIVRQDGIAGNWVWWAFMLTGLLTVFVYAKLWRRSDVKTDMEFYNLRYSGKAANFLRAFRSIYLGLLFNVLAMSGVTLAAIKIGQVMLGFTALETVAYAAIITMVFSALGGFRGVVYSDFLLFFVAMVGSIGAAYYVVSLPEIGSLHTLFTHDNVRDKLNFIPNFYDLDNLIPLFIIPLAVQWWSSWYPGAEPGGGGYIAQRMLAAKNENHAIGATFFFNVMHYAVRPWPWILVALASLIIFPDLASLKTAFPNISPDKLGHDLAYPAMLTYLPVGWTGLVVASLVAAYMSTISTHLNWGASYLVNDVYKQFINRQASEKNMVVAGRISTVILMLLSTFVALVLTNAVQLFKYILMFGAGTGLIFILRWLWWRINAWSEISAMISSGLFSILFGTDQVQTFFFSEQSGLFPAWAEFPLMVLITSIIWVSVTLLTQPDEDEKLFAFYRKIQPWPLGWKTIIQRAEKQNITLVDHEVKQTLPQGISCMIYGCLSVYALLFTSGNLLKGDYVNTAISLTASVLFGYLLYKKWIAMNSNQTTKS
ncbi:MAG: sodium:solute symporter family protein [Flavobacteriaceae bacterium]